MIRIARKLMAAAFLTTAVAQAQAPPHLLLGPEDFPRLNELAQRQAWAAKQRDEILSKAAAFPNSYVEKYGLQKLELPPEGAQWSHFYACPDTGTTLRFHPPNHNVCPDNGKEYNGRPYDQVVYQERAFDLANGALDSALAFRLAGDQAFAVKAATVLKLYADKYLSYPVHGIAGREHDQNGGRIFAQNLDEAEFLIKVAWTYDLIRDTDVLTAADRLHIENDLIRACAATTGQANGATLNITSWIDSALVAAGYVLGDKELVRRGIDGPIGFRAQMKENVVDGFWLEGAIGYQYYAIEPLELTAQMAARAGVDLWKQEPDLEKLLLSPLDLMFPDGTTPAFNDANGGHHILDERANLYEAAYSATRNPSFGAVCQRAKRNSREAFLFGVPSIAVESLPRPKSAIFPVAGLATLRAPSGDLTEIMKFGPQGGVHGHFDKLGEIIYANGEVLSVDPGTQKYGLPIHFTWDRMTVAHNTVSVDETAQAPATGKLISWQAEPDFTAVTADAGPAYANATLRRTSLLTSEYIFEITTGRSTDGKAHDFDWTYHNYGTQKADATFKPYRGFPQRDGYQILESNRVAIVTGDFHTRFTLSDGKGMDLWMLAAPVSSYVFTGVAPSQKLSVKAAYTIIRRRGTAATFVAVLQPRPSTAAIVSVTQLGSTMHIRSGAWEDTIELGEKVGYHRLLLH